MSVLARIAIVAVTVAVSLAALAGPAFAAEYVIDEAGILPAEVAARIESLSAELEKSTDKAPEVAVLIVKSLDGKDIATYAEERFNALGVGQAAANNGVLFVIAPVERKARIEVGYGLEGALPDSRAGRILDDTVFPKFKADDMPAGIEAGHIAIVAAVAEEYGVSIGGVTGVDTSPAASDDSIDVYVIAICVVIFIIFALIGVFSRGRGGGGPWTGGGGDWSGGGGDSGGGGGFGGGDSGGGGADGGW
ncbi:MAG: TPM domain-containing protein [Coriobacteriia bacterium]|nr:TPM domain-containing protein [Coriobacteriia bacterium]